MREIKFRLWDIDAKKWVFEYRYIVAPLGLMSEWAHDKGFALMQYTGLKDRNGTEIYEGDIVSDGQELFQVRYGITTAAFVWKHVNGSNNPKRSAPLRYGEKYEVVGNTYENPELLSAQGVA